MIDLSEEQFTLTVSKGHTGMWFVTGSMHRGLLVIGRDLAEVLSRVPGAWDELRRADAEKPPQPLSRGG